MLWVDIGAMAARITGLRSNPEECRHTGAQAAENVKKYDVALAGEKIHAIFQQAIKSHQPAKD